MEKAIILQTKESIIDKLDKFTKSESEFDPNEFTGLYELLTPALSLSGHDIIFSEMSEYKKINVYQKSSLVTSQKKVYHKVYEFTNPNESIPEDKVLNLIVSYGIKPDYKSHTFTHFYKGPDTMANTEEMFVNNQKKFVESFYNPNKSEYLPVTINKLYGDIVFEYIRKLQDTDLYTLYGDMFKDVINYYFTIGESSITFNKIPLIDAFTFSHSTDVLFNMFNNITSLDVDYFLLSNKEKLKIMRDTYVPTVLTSSDLNIQQIFELIVNNCTLLNFEQELYNLYLRTKNIILLKIMIYFNYHLPKYNVPIIVTEYYLQFKYKPIRTYADVIYNKKLRENINWFLSWDITYMNLIQTEYQTVNTTFDRLILLMYIGNNLTNGDENFKGININSYLPITSDPLSESELMTVEMIRSKRILSQPVSMSMPAILNLNYLSLLDTNHYNVFSYYVLKKTSLLYTQSEPINMNANLIKMLELIANKNINYEIACKVWKFCYDNYFSTVSIENSLLIFPTLLVFFVKSYKKEKELTDFINYVIEHNKSIDTKYINYTVPADFNKSSVEEIFYSVQIVSLLDYFMNKNSVTKTKAVELGLIPMSFKFGWVEGFTRIIDKLGGINELKTLIRDGICDPNNLNVSDDNFITFMDLIIAALKKFEKKDDINKTIFKPYLLRFIESKITYIEEEDEEKIIYLINSFIEILKFYNGKIVGGKPLVSKDDMKKFWELKDKQVNIIHLAAATGSVKLLEHLLITAKSDIKISFSSETDYGRNILFYIKNIEQLDLILSLPGLTAERLADIFYKVDAMGRSVFYTWFTKETSIVKDLLDRVLPRLPVPLNYSADIIISGFTEPLTKYLVDNPIDNMDTLIPLLKTHNLVSQEIELYFVISKNIKKTDLTPADIEELKLILVSEQINDLLKNSLNKNYENTLLNLFDLDTAGVTLKYYVNYIIKNIETITSIKQGIYLNDVEGNKAIELLLPYIYKNSILLNDIMSFLETMVKLGKADEIRQIHFLPSLLEIPTGINYTPNKTHIRNCFSFAFHIIKKYVSDDEINKEITLKSGKYKPIHELCGFGRSHTWKNIGGYLNLYYYLYGKTTPMPDFIMPSGYEIIRAPIETTTFIENDFDMELIPDSADKVNIPVFDHYLNFPTITELADFHYAYTYEHKTFPLM